MHLFLLWSSGYCRIAMSTTFTLFRGPDVYYFHIL